MRIAQVAPLSESVPPKLYGGTERVVSYLTEELVRRGHDVTLFASGDSATTARLRRMCEKALRLDCRCHDPLPYAVLMLEKVLQEMDDFDLVHFHTDYLHFPCVRRHRTSTLTTLHGRLDLPSLAAVYREFHDIPVVSISDAQRVPLPWLNWAKTVYHGLPRDLLRPAFQPGRYIAFLGRICPEKRPDRAIDIARRFGMKLKIAAKVDAVDQDYFDERIRPMLNLPGVEFIGEINESEKNDFLGDAYALLFPIDWPEPFGLAMIEAMACGTPVIAYRCGSVAEVVDDGLTGYVVETRRQAVEALRKVANLDRTVVRHLFEERFSVERMVDDYLAIYDASVGEPARPVRVA